MVICNDMMRKVAGGFNNQLQLYYLWSLVFPSLHELHLLYQQKNGNANVRPVRAF